MSSKTRLRREAVDDAAEDVEFVVGEFGDDDEAVAEGVLASPRMRDWVVVTGSATLSATPQGFRRRASRRVFYNRKLMGNGVGTHG